jgi:leucine dehydrogenase
MTYKNAVAGLPFGGGKAVILAADSAPKSEALFRALGRAVDSLGGSYVTAEDVGINIDDMRIVREATPYVSGLPQASNSAGGDPSPWTAYGVYLGMRAAAKARLGKDTLEGLRIAVQGVGSVGLHLCKLLRDAGATVIVADVNRDNLRRATQLDGVRRVSPREILFADVDILAPCALGNILNSESIPRIRAKVVAGAANNQLSTERRAPGKTRHPVCPGLRDQRGRYHQRRTRVPGTEFRRPGTTRSRPDSGKACGYFP